MIAKIVWQTNDQVEVYGIFIPCGPAIAYDENDCEVARSQDSITWTYTKVASPSPAP